MMQRIVIVGSGSSGQSMLAQQIGAVLHGPKKAKQLLSGLTREK